VDPSALELLDRAQERRVLHEREVNEMRGWLHITVTVASLIAAIVALLVAVV
jgi:hypothetical protein